MSEVTPTEASVPRGALANLSESFQYLYFLRIPLLLWLALPLLAALDAYTDLSALTRGVFTPPVDYAFGAAEFFVICIGMVALLTARIVCINGESRFTTKPPSWIQRSLGRRSQDWAWRTLFFFQVPGLYVIYQYHRNAHIEHAVLNYGPSILVETVWSVVGVVAAVLFWRFINALYYWASCLQPRPVKAIPLLWPRQDDQGESIRKSIEVPLAIKPLLGIFRFIAARGEGYSEDGKTLFEGHQLATVGALIYLAVYLVLAPITAPTRHTFYTTLALLFLGMITTLIAWNIARVPALHISERRTRNKIVFSFSVVAFVSVAAAISTLFSRVFADWIWFEHFPVLVAVTVLLTAFLFLFSGIAFWADRHRIPVLTLSIAGIVLLQFLVHTVFHVTGEHIFRPSYASVTTETAHPSDAYKHYRDAVCAGRESCPLIIVTASGGGIHAAAWTATVLTELEEKFAKSDSNFTFHDHLLLISSVSGGSVGTLPFLREYYAPKPFDESLLPLCDDKKVDCTEPIWSGQVRRAAFCSSLGGVGWGLEYGDLFRLLAPELPFTNNLTDRSQALEDTFRRNLTDKSCDPTYSDDRFGANDGIDQLTLAQMMADLHGGDARRPRVPAFSFNSTVAETGGRFLFSNYENDPYGYFSFGVAPSESWLSAYYDGSPSRPNLSLVTAARLSATFPYVSSAARVGGLETEPVQHFVDGGYFDNDGTATAIEFLEQIFRPSIPDSERSDPKPARPPAVPILFIEIRDGSDLNPTKSDDHLTWPLVSKAETSWTPASQVTAPLKAFWNAGHSSITTRNRRELELLMEALQDSGTARFRHLVFDYQPPQDASQVDDSKAKPNDTRKKAIDHEAAQPLSWHLTPNQEHEIRDSLLRLSTCSASAVYWAKTGGLGPSDPTRPRSPEVECDRLSAEPHPASR